jgi:hypothetical protein
MQVMHSDSAAMTSRLRRFFLTTLTMTHFLQWDRTTAFTEENGK